MFQRGTLAGNLLIKHDYHEFPSDVFLLLETVNATITVGKYTNYSSYIQDSK